MDRIGPIPRTAEVLIVFNGYAKHLEEGKYFRITMERLFRAKNPNLRLIVDDRSVAQYIVKARGMVTTCEVEYAGLYPDRSSGILIKHEDVITGFAFTHESMPKKLIGEWPAKEWAAVTGRVLRPTRLK